MQKTALPKALMGVVALGSMALSAPAAHAACGASTTQEGGGEQVAKPVNPNSGYGAELGFATAGSLPTIANGLDRLQAAAVNSAVNNANTSSCDGYSAPVVATSMSNTRGLLRDTALRLEKLRAAKQAAGKSSMYVIGAIPSYLHAQETYTRRHDLTVGADHRYNDQWVAGASIGLAHSNFFTSDKSDGRIDGTGGTLTAYGSWSPTASSYVSAAISLENMHYSLNDSSLVGAPARADGFNTGLSLSAGYDAQIGSWTASPFVRVDHITSRMNSLDNDDAINKGRSSSSTLGAQLSTQMSMNWGVLSPHVRIEGTRVNGWSLKGASADLYSEAAVVAGVPDPNKLDRTYGQAGVGAAALFPGGTTIFGDFDRTFGLKGVTSWRFTLGLRTEL